MPKRVKEYRGHSQVLERLNLKNAHLLLVLFCFTGLFLAVDSYNHITLLIVGCILANIIQKKSAKIDINETTLVFGFSLLTAIAIKHFYGYSSSSLRIIALFFLLSLFLPKATISKHALSTIIVIASISTVSYSLFQYFILDKGRYWDINPILHGTFTSTMVCLCLFFCLTASKKKEQWLYFGAGTLFAFSLNLSESRGPLLSMLITGLCIVIFLCFSKRCKHKQAIIVFVTFLIFSTANSQLLQRVFYKSEMLQTSSLASSTSGAEKNVQARFDMWKQGVLLLQEQFPNGYGNETTSLMNNMLDEKGISYFNGVNFQHFHNQYIDYSVRYGFLGIIFVILLFSFPFYFALKHRTDNTYILAIASLVYAINSLTDVPLSHKPTLAFFLFMFIVAIWYQPSENKQSHIG
ncbi:O-antigen ligase family protein [Vibrio sp. 05-20-BW147]|uniref:O-antigen ligase family protein n=1 Tax=Vibrio sp. 05-20-BW147 TaxID=2575834 RepID=UPI001594B558|nr:O-antigen ligase family protein [Vibrio sp. 05-20-BW147]